MPDSGNVFRLVCPLCGMELSYYDMEKDEDAWRQFMLKIGAGKKTLKRFSPKILLACNEHGGSYLLYEIQPIKYEYLEISEDLPEKIAADLGMEIKFDELLSVPGILAYQVVYSFGTKMKKDRLGGMVTNRKPSPSNHILDNVKLYMCVPVPINNGKVKNILLAIVAKRKKGRVTEFDYIIVWHEVLHI